ncbi:MAG: carbohydrate porin [Pseudomonadota bacterium]
MKKITNASPRQRRSVRLTAAMTVAASTLLLAPAAHAQNDLLNWLNQDTATGNWGGARDDLTNKGIDVELNFTTDLLGNPVGGIRQNAAYAGLWYGSTTFDLETLAGINGLSLYIAGAWAQGRDLSGDDIGNLFAVAQVFNGRALRLAEVYLEQSLFSDKVSVAVGRLSAGDDFAAADAYGFYVNSAVNGNPTGILVNAPSFTTPPFTQWGARATVTPRPDFYVSAGIYNADPDVQEDAYHGLDFTLNPQDGVLGVAEIGYKPNSGDGATGLPGQYSLGAYFDTSNYPFVDGSNRSRDGNYGFYAIAQQMIYQESAGSGQGLTIWGTVNVAPEEDINTLPVALFGGAYYQGLFPKRPNDVTAFGISYAAFSERLPGQTYELALEVNHRFQLGNWLHVQPNAQAIINPNGGGIPDALVGGGEVSIDF